MTKESPEGTDYIRPCTDYYEEYTSCKSWSNRLQYYYAFGTFKKKIECQPWKEMFELCNSSKNGNERAKETLVAMEKANCDDIIRNRTDVWTYRDNPPLLWHFPGKTRKDFEQKSNAASSGI